MIVTAVIALAVPAFVVLLATSRAGDGRARFTPLRVSADLALVDRIPMEPGDLAGFNVLLVTLDTTRADRLGCYGFEDAATPVLDGLARRGVIFSHALTVAPLTLPSHASILTGRYPFHHGARNNTMSRLDDDAVSIAELLADRGYRTAAMVSAFVLDSHVGLDQGFAEYDDTMGSTTRQIGQMIERRGDDTTDRAVRWLQRDTGEPFFLWVHYFDPHQPYEAPDPFAGRHEHPYDAEIAFTDMQVGRLLEAVEQTGQTSRTLVIVVGDHGQSLGQHDELTHGMLLYDSSMRVPLIVHCGDRLTGHHVERPVSLVDIMPTMLGLLGVPVPRDVDGIDLCRAIPGDRPIIMETVAPLTAYGWSPLLAVRAGDHKYIYGPAPELYDINADPDERRDTAHSDAEMVASLHLKLRAFYGDLDRAMGFTPSRAPGTVETARLRSLGYLGGAIVENVSGTPRHDPRTMMPLYTEVNMVVGLEETIGVDGVLARLDAIAEAHPEFVPTYRMIAEAAIKKGDLDRAVEAMEQRLAVAPEQIGAMLFLARLHARRGRAEDAAALYGEFLELAPDQFEAMFELAQVQRLSGDYDGAVDTLIAALGVQPRDGRATDLLIDTAMVAGRTPDAAEAIGRQLQARPDLVTLRAAMARLYMSLLRFGDAVRVLREGLDRDPGRPELTNNLALVLITAVHPQVRDPVEAISLMTALCAETEHSDPVYLHTLSLSYEAAGRPDDALSAGEAARSAAAASDNPDYASLGLTIGRSLARYRRELERGNDES
ncbi:MAG: sulfatase-like hydrolase/transferase [Planctomycetes bacterium]|nr:sulfatase-like hydrolase/transferase [Planctomycetota bacterium]